MLVSSKALKNTPNHLTYLNHEVLDSSLDSQFLITRRKMFGLYLR